MVLALLYWGVGVGGYTLPCSSSLLDLVLVGGMARFHSLQGWLDFGVAWCCCRFVSFLCFPGNVSFAVGRHFGHSCWCLFHTWAFWPGFSCGFVYAWWCLF